MTGSNSKHWVLLAAGSKGWEDYGHQANVCHAYQIVHRNGIPDEQIVVMMHDDIAQNNKNPVPGTIINVPNGPNVYTGVPKDYTGEEVSAKNFLAALCGDSTAGKKVIRSDENDTIFVYLSSHGSHGHFSFPYSTLNADDLVKTVKEMSRKRKFLKMVIYVGACHSGSMLEKLSEERNVYAVSSCKPDEVSYGHYYDKKRDTCLSDVFSAHWLYNLENVNLSTNSFGDQFSYLKKNASVTKKMDKNQTPCNYGDMRILQLKLSEFLGRSPPSILETYSSFLLKFFDVFGITTVSPIVQENRSENEQNLEKHTLERQHDESKKDEMEFAVKRIAEKKHTSHTVTES
ncbi:legumain-like [Silurus meridionalis]|uniref:legumain-like n=1 Tax=Silurus meridionalis TaxID=175797 RepID=UPI001EECB65A|nr:legumain-like [Silurus meridionalis]